MRRTLALAAVALTALLAPAAAHAHSVKEYKLEQYAVPADITAGPDGALWAPDGSLGRLWRITTAGRISYVELGGSPAGVAAGPDGALWVTDRTFDRIQRVTTAGAVTNYPLPTPGAFPLDIAAGPDGALWFTEAHADRIGRIAVDGTVTEYPLPTTGAFPGDIAAGPDGALWFTEQLGDKVGRITTAGQVTEFPLAAGALPGPIVAGADGALWFSERNTDTIARMTTDGVVTQRFTLPTANADPLALLAGRRGRLVVGQHSAGSLVALRRDGRFGHELRLRSHPDALTRGPDGDVWYVSGDEGRIGHVRR
jgi:virginiamycin B lyase